MNLLKDLKMSLLNFTILPTINKMLYSLKMT